MFKEISSTRKEARDFLVSLISIDEGSAKIRIGPRYRPLNKIDSFPLPQRDGSFSDFYSPDYSPRGQTAASTFDIVKNNKSLGGPEAISRYLPTYALKDGTMSRVFSGGEFKIPFDQKIYFWMRIPILQEALPSVSKDNIQIVSPRIEFGASIKSTPTREVYQNISYSVSNIPFLSVIAKKSGLEVEYFEIGEVKYSYLVWKVPGQDFTPYKISNLSSFYKN